MYRKFNRFFREKNARDYEPARLIKTIPLPSNSVESASPFLLTRTDMLEFGMNCAGHLEFCSRVADKIYRERAVNETISCKELAHALNQSALRTATGNGWNERLVHLFLSALVWASPESNGPPTPTDAGSFGQVETEVSESSAEEATSVTEQKAIQLSDAERHEWQEYLIAEGISVQYPKR